MGYLSKFVGVSAALMLLSVSIVGAEERDPVKPRVPAEQMADAKATKNPSEATPERLPTLRHFTCPEGNRAS
ncbi:MAG: hypothetical protein HP490_12755 [Nitrospira sp.]|nr:hypothetical protein [Nitrospira sp.]